MCSPFPTPCCAGGSGRRCCRWTRNWKRLYSTAWTPSGAPSSLRPHFIAKSFRTLTKKPGTAKAIPDYFGSGKRAWSRLPAGVLLPSGERPATTEAGSRDRRGRAPQMASAPRHAVLEWMWEKVPESGEGPVLPGPSRKSENVWCWFGTVMKFSGPKQAKKSGKFPEKHEIH